MEKHKAKIIGAAIGIFCLAGFGVLAVAQVSGANLTGALRLFRLQAPIEQVQMSPAVTPPVEQVAVPAEQSVSSELTSNTVQNSPVDTPPSIFAPSDNSGADSSPVSNYDPCKVTGLTTTNYLCVSKASETPGVGTITTKTGNHTLLVVQFNSDSSTSQVTAMTLTKTGIYNDAAVKVAAYDKDGVQISNEVTFAEGKATLTFNSPVVLAGESAKVWVKVSISGTSSGTLGLKVNSANDVDANASTVSGYFPLASATMNVVDGTSEANSFSQPMVVPLSFDGLKAKENSPFPGTPSIFAPIDNSGADSSPVADNEPCKVDSLTRASYLCVSKSASSPSGDNLRIGQNDAVLGIFEMTAVGEDMELQRLKLDLSSKKISTGPQNLVDQFECSSSYSCDLTGSIKFMVDENLDGVPDKTLLTLSAAPTTVADMWDVNSLANQDLSAFYTVQKGKTVNLMIIGNITSSESNTAPGESIQIGVKDIYYYMRSSLKYGVAATKLLQANQLSIEDPLMKSIVSPLPFGGLKGKESNPFTQMPSIFAPIDNSGANSNPIANNEPCQFDALTSATYLCVTKDSSSPSGAVLHLGNPPEVLGTFAITAVGEDMELHNVKLDLSSNKNSIGPQNKIGTFECDDSYSEGGCDFQGSIVIVVDENLNGAFELGDTRIGDVDVDHSTPFNSSFKFGDVWNIKTLAPQRLTGFYTVKAGQTIHLLIIGSVTPNIFYTGPGEGIQVGLKDLSYYKKSSLTFGTAARSLVQANLVTVRSAVKRKK